MALKTHPSDEFCTPPDVADLAKKVLGDIYFDPYGHPKQLVKVRTMHTAATGVQPWPTHGPWYVNPPFSASGTQIPRVSAWVAEHRIDCLMLCLAAPGSMYWRESIWSKTGPQRVAWMPRLSFFQVDENPELEVMLNVDTGEVLTPRQVRALPVDEETGLSGAVPARVKNPAYGKMGPTPQSISRDLALMLWSTNPVVIARFVREVTAYAKEANPKAAPIGISLGGGPQP